MGLALYRVAQLRDLEQRAAAALPAGTLMQRAGRAAAAAIEQAFSRGGRRAIVLCGPGNNGGDGYQTALDLQACGWQVVCVAVMPAVAVDARAAAARWTAAGGVTLDKLPDSTHGALLIDALFGIGLARPLSGEARVAARWLSAQQCPIVALDIPSGLDADTGTWVGDVRGASATHTVTFIACKPGLFTRAGRGAVGRLTVADLDLTVPASGGAVCAPTDFPALLAPRAQDTHKGTFGDVVVVGGGVGMTGAALLAARGALRLGAGRVFVDLLGAPDLRFDPSQPELMLRPNAALPRGGVWVTGCGMGSDESARRALLAAFDKSDTLLLDADALNLLASDATLFRQLHDARQCKVLTPHPLEAARLLGTDAEHVQSDRVASALTLAQRTRSTVVLKGAGSVVATADGSYWINPTGGPALATAGSGDVLAGICGALLAQGGDPLQAVLAAVWLHGAAADMHGSDIGLVAGDLPKLAARAWAKLRTAAPSPS